MLVIVENWDIEDFLQARLNLKTARCGDILQVDAAECGGNVSDSLDNLLGILGYR